MIAPEKLALELRRMDAFLICYDVKKDQSKGTNYHKVSEYLVYGRPIVSNYVSAYDYHESGVHMVPKYESNEFLEGILQSCIISKNKLAPVRINTYQVLILEIIQAIQAKKNG